VCNLKVKLFTIEI